MVLNRRKASLTINRRTASRKSCTRYFSGLPFLPHVPAMAKEAKKLAQDTGDATVRLRQQGKGASKNLANKRFKNIECFTSF